MRQRGFHRRSIRVGSPFLPAEFPLFLILFLKGYEQVAVHTAVFIQSDFPVELVGSVFRGDSDRICPLLRKLNIGERFFDAIERAIVAA